MFSMALDELQELESKPLCHRIAARLLVNNCHLLDHQDEATTHLDSGRATRDFVDSYAASLAICDLERGSFAIPSSCYQFRETTLAALPVPKHPRLHVSTLEIDSCLEGLAQSDSAWNTWVSYRHKALRFCEVARAENEKDQSIHVSQQVTKILEKLTIQVEVELWEKMKSLNRVVQSTADSVDNIAVRVDRAGVEFASVIARLQQVTEESNISAKGGLETAKNLQQILTLLLRTAMDATADLVISQETALQALSKTATDDIGSLTSALHATLISSASLQHQMDVVQMKTEDMLLKQTKIKEEMESLEGIANHLRSKFSHHEGQLGQVQQQAEQILVTLEVATASVESLRNSLFSGLNLSAVWPYIVCPIASLVMGSYRLEPSITRNLWLVGIGASGIYISPYIY
ncbi:hypothetical protein BGZ63DRAFT_478074 [Mariannaea sp. PMI_226]|nr:hypothetical protein BGZ63DRAFT_478074 [Mariannaea sp. PMI_226]